jgi:nucleoside-diphosphate-sugar epimerase
MLSPDGDTMRIFLTGATGYIGSAVLDACVRAGHEVTALVRDSRKGAQVQARGATPLVGDLADGRAWQDTAERHVAFVHTAFEYSPRGAEVDRAALEALLAAARGYHEQQRVVIYTSGVWVLGPSPSPVDEDAPIHPISLVAWRPAHEALVLGATRPGLRAIVVRPGIVYGGGRGIVSDLLKDGANGLIRVVGDGRNRWALIYDRDLAELYVRLLATQGAAGIFHANDEGDERVVDIVESIARSMKIPADIRHIPIEEARAKMGPYADALALDQVVRSRRARTIGWVPTLRSVRGNVPRLAEEWRRAHE